MTSSKAIICRYLAYATVADGMIDNREIHLIDKVLRDAQLTASEIQGINHILIDSPEKQDLEQLLKDFLLPENWGVHISALEAALTLTYCDGYLDPGEDAFFNRCIEAWGIDRDDFNRLKMSVIHKMEKDKSAAGEHSFQDWIFPWLLNFIGGLRRIAPNRYKQRIGRVSDRIRLSGPEYNRAIDMCRDIANADLAFVEEQLEKDISLLQDFYRKMEETSQQLENQSRGEARDFNGLVRSLQKHVNEDLVASIETDRQILYKKKRTAGCFTIAFFGKTKVGKSTLHAVLTGQGFDQIGEGQQRTTRYNRVYQWKKLRIIDTPGIGAPGGQSDEFIAASVVDEADVICYLVKNDSIQESEFRFLRQLRAKHKMVIIVLNIKEDLTNEVRLKLYLKDPEKCFQRKDAKCIDGHITRFNRYCEEMLGEPPFRIIPVQLLAAQMSMEAEYSKHKSILWDASHMQELMDALRLFTLEYGPILRSKNILEGAAAALGCNIAILSNYQEQFREMYDYMIKQREALKSFMEELRAKYATRLQQNVDMCFQSLQKGVYQFVSQNCECKSEKEFNQRWQEPLINNGFEQGLKSALDRVFVEYQDEVEGRLQEITEDFDFVFHVETMFNAELPGTFDFHQLFSYMNIIGDILVGLAPFTEGISIVFACAFWGLSQMGKWFTKSKEDKNLETTTKIYEELTADLKRQQGEVKTKVRDAFLNQHRMLTFKVDDSFGEMIHIMEEHALADLDLLINEAEQAMSRLDQAYAWRLMNYARFGNSLPAALAWDDIQSTVIRVTRPEAKRIQITTGEAVNSDMLAALSELVQTEIIVVKQQGGMDDE